MSSHPDTDNCSVSLIYVNSKNIQCNYVSKTVDPHQHNKILKVLMYSSSLTRTCYQYVQSITTHFFTLIVNLYLFIFNGVLFFLTKIDFIKLCFLKQKYRISNFVY